MESYLSVVVRDRQDAIVVTPDGELDMASAPHLGAALDRLPRTPRARLILELRDLRFVDVSGLRMLLRAREQARDLGGELSLVNAPNTLQRLLQLTGATDLLETQRGHDQSAREGVRPRADREQGTERRKQP
jgi:anti-sigma B factor antagonist